jgi:hypothetical protein
VTDSKNQGNIIKPSIDQLPEEIRKMLEERANPQAAADLERALACFEVDRRGAIKKIQDVNFNPFLATSTSEVKIDQHPLVLALHMMNVLR